MKAKEQTIIQFGKKTHTQPLCVCGGGNINSFRSHSPSPTHLLGLAVVITSNRRVGLLPCDVPLGGTLLHVSCQLVVCNVVVVTVRTGTRTM